MKHWQQPYCRVHVCMLLNPRYSSISFILRLLLVWVLLFHKYFWHQDEFMLNVSLLNFSWHPWMLLLQCLRAIYHSISHLYPSNKQWCLPGKGSREAPPRRPQGLHRLSHREAGVPTDTEADRVLETKEKWNPKIWRSVEKEIKQSCIRGCH